MAAGPGDVRERTTTAASGVAAASASAGYAELRRLCQRLALFDAVRVRCCRSSRSRPA